MRTTQTLCAAVLAVSLAAGGPAIAQQPHPPMPQPPAQQPTPAPGGGGHSGGKFLKWALPAAIVGAIIYGATRPRPGQTAAADGPATEGGEMPMQPRPRACPCDSLSILPVLEKDKKGNFDLDKPKVTVAGEIDPADPTRARFTLTIDWATIITCAPGDGDCTGTFAPAATSAGWSIGDQFKMGDKKKAVNVSTEKHAAKGGGAVNCEGKCDPNHGISHNAVKQTQYEVTIQKGEGTQGQVGSSRVAGTVTLEMNGAGCANNGKSKLVIKIDAADLHKGAGQRRIGWSVDQAGSDYDGDGDTNQQEVRDKTNPLVAGS